MTSMMRTWRLAAVAGLTLGAFACSESSTDVVDQGPGFGPQLAEIDLSNPAGGSVNVNDGIWTFPVPFNVGTGRINPFLSVQDSPEEEGFNTDASPLPLDDKRPNFTNALPLNHVPTIEGPGMGLFREFILDMNESNSGVEALLSIDRFDLWLCNDAGAPAYDTRSDFQSNGDCELVYDIDDDVGGSDVDYIRATDEVTSGSGLDLDYQILIPEQNFIDAANAVGADLTGCAYQGVEADPCGAFLVLDTRMGFQGGNLVTNATFEEYSTIKRPFITVSKDANPSLVRTHQWDIEKSVDIDEHNLFTGESDSSKYTVDVIYNGSIDSDWAVEGEITIENPSDDDVTINGVSDVISGVGAISVDCGVSFPFVLGDGDTLVCTYESDLPDGTDRLNTATVDAEGLAVGMATADILFAEASVTEVDATATVDDSFEGALGSATAPNEPSFMYSREFTCDEDEGEHENIATITADDTGTFSSDTALVTVNCNAIRVEKTVETSFTRTYEWEIDKAIDPTGAACNEAALMNFDVATKTATVSESEILDVCYVVTVDTAGFTDSDWAVSGTITVFNDHPSSAAVLDDVTDLVSPDIDADVTCPSLTVPASGSLVCTYEADLPDGTSRTNTATATLFGVAYDSNAEDVIFGDPSEEVDECLEVEDTLGGSLGTVCVGVDPLPHSFDYVITFDAAELECGDNMIPNTATGETNDLLIVIDDDENINIFVECAEGCTLTQGYWKTHNDSFHGGASKKADPTWELIGDADGDLSNEAELETFFLSGDTWFGVFWTAPKGNAYYNLAHQYMAAVLNALAGATPPSDVQDAIDAATLFFQTYSPAAAAALPKQDPGTPGVIDSREEVVAAAGLLADFNEGLVGPGHCTENEES